MAQDPNNILQAVRSVVDAIEYTPSYISRVKYNGSISQALRISDVMKDQADSALVTHVLSGQLSAAPNGVEQGVLSRVDGFFENVVNGLNPQGSMLRQFKMGAYRGKPGPYLYLLACALCWVAMESITHTDTSDTALISQWLADMIPDMQPGEMPSFLRLVTEVSQWMTQLSVDIDTWHGVGSTLVRAGIASPLKLWMLPGLVFSEPQTLLAAADSETELAIELLSNAGLLPMATHSTHGVGVYCKHRLGEGMMAGVYQYSGPIATYSNDRLKQLHAVDGRHYLPLPDTEVAKMWAQGTGIGDYGAALIHRAIDPKCTCGSCWEFCIAYWLRARQGNIQAAAFECDSVINLDIEMQLLAKQWAHSVGLVRSGLLRREQADVDLVMWHALYNEAIRNKYSVGVIANGELMLLDPAYGRCMTGMSGLCVFRPILKGPHQYTQYTILQNLTSFPSLGCPINENQKEVIPDDVTGAVRIWAEVTDIESNLGSMSVQFRGSETQVFDLKQVRSVEPTDCKHDCMSMVLASADSAWTSLVDGSRPEILLTHNNPAARIMGVIKAADAGLDVVVQGNECLACCLNHGQVVVDGLVDTFNN